MRRRNNSVETVNAAATAIVTAEIRVQQVTSPRRRWGGCLGMFLCFGSQRHDKRISHAVFVPLTTLSGSDPAASENQIHSPTLVLPFTAPPSSPASFLQSELPSATQSPGGLIPVNAISANVYSPSGPASIFAIGPYANERQLVSPPVFSTFTTEPSTAPLTPPQEHVHLTTPSSPEVPFAQLLTPSLDSSHIRAEVYEFPSYQLYPGSPIGHLISPSSVCSDTSSPFPDLEFRSSNGRSFPSFPTGEPPKLSAEGFAVYKLTPGHKSRNGASLLDGQISAVASAPMSDDALQKGGSAVNQIAPFELCAEEVAHCLQEELAISGNSNPGSSLDEKLMETEVNQPSKELENSNRCCVDQNYHDLPEQLGPSTASCSSKDFKFDNTDRTPAEPDVGSDWWANEKVIGAEAGPSKNCAFSSKIQPGER